MPFAADAIHRQAEFHIQRPRLRRLAFIRHFRMNRPFAMVAAPPQRFQ